MESVTSPPLILDYNLVASRNNLRIIAMLPCEAKLETATTNNLPYDERTAYAREITTLAY